MTPERWRRIQDLFHSALECDPPGRAVFLARSCPDDLSLQAEVAVLLAAHEQASSFLETPHMEPFARGIEPCAGEPLAGSYIGPYRLIRVLGSGGMGVVYEAEQPNPRRRVALKVVRGGSYVDEHRVKLFRCEVQALAQLQHPAIAAIYEAGRTEEGQYFFTMELVDGLPLNVYVQEKHVPPRERLELFRKICEALHYAHQRGVIHQDLKPSNILVDAQGHPKILDFGLARVTSADLTLTFTLTETGNVRGTLFYMSPEQARGRSHLIDGRSDVYSLGVILYELMTRQLPYAVTKAAPYEILRAICDEPPQKPSTMNRSLRGDLETMFLKALEKEPSRRYPSAAALAEDVERYLTGRPILARAPGLIYRLRQLTAHHRARAASLMAILALLCAGLLLWPKELSITKATDEDPIVPKPGDYVVSTGKPSSGDQPRPLRPQGSIVPTDRPAGLESVAGFPSTITEKVAARDPLGKNGWLWPEDFEDVPPKIGKLPEKGWVAGGANDLFGVVEMSAYQGQRALFLFGALGQAEGRKGGWAAQVAVPLAGPDHPGIPVESFSLSFAIRPGGETLSGAHPTGALVRLLNLLEHEDKHPPDKSGHTLLVVAPDGTFSGHPGQALGAMSPGTWYTMKIAYTRVDAQSMRLEYWLNDKPLPPREFPPDLHQDDLIWLGFAVDEGSVWFDAIRFEGGGFTWQEDFEEVPRGILSLPEGWKVEYGNNEYGVLETVRGQGDRSLYLYGSPRSPSPRPGLRLWPEGGWPGVVGSVIVPSQRYVQEFVVDFRVRSGSEKLVGSASCRARLDMQTLSPAQYTVENRSRRRTLFRVLGDGTLVGPNDERIGSMRLDTWSRLRIHYTAEPKNGPNTVRIHYRLDDTFLSEQTMPAADFERSLVWFHWIAGEGSVWFDDIRFEGGDTSWQEDFEQAPAVKDPN